MKQFRTQYITIYQCEWTYGGAEEGGWWNWLKQVDTIIPVRNAKQLKKALSYTKRVCKEFNDSMEGTDRNGFDDHLEYYLETKGQDCMLVNGVLFDWKELRKPEIVGEFIDLVFNCMSGENSRKKLENMLNK